MSRRPCIVVSDAFSARTFASCGILSGFCNARRGDVDIVFNFDLDLAASRYAFKLSDWPAEMSGVCIRQECDVFNKGGGGLRTRFQRAMDGWLDERFGYFSLAMRFNRRHGFMIERMSPGHPNPFLDPRRGRPFVGSPRLYRRLFAWYYGTSRFIEPGLLDYMREHVSVLLTSNLQFRSVQPWLIAARRLGIPVIGNIASWDHPVGKGVVFPWCARYLVQNEYMRDVLIRYHGIEASRVVVTGWPQTDLYAIPRPREAYRALLGSYGLDPARPCILFTGNTENNNPSEPKFMARVLDGWSAVARPGPSIIFRPHPKDHNWRERFGFLVGRPGVHVQAASYTDTDVLALLLQHVDAVVTNAGTVLLDSLINDRPVVCVVYDEGGSVENDLAGKNVTGHHYRDLMQSNAFIVARSLAEVMEGVQRCLSHPEERGGERRAIVERVVGSMDGKAGQRVIQEMMRSLDEDPAE